MKTISTEYALPAVGKDVLIFTLGEYILRRRSSDKEPEWILTRINETYLELIKEFPEDYRMPTSQELINK